MVCCYALIPHLPPYQTHKLDPMSDIIKTSLKPTSPALSKRYTKSVRYVLVSHSIGSSPHYSVSSVDVQHLEIPAALFTDAVDPEYVPVAPPDHVSS